MLWQWAIIKNGKIVKRNDLEFCIFPTDTKNKFMSKQSEFYDKLKVSLEETTTFPTNYMFKFIIPTDKDKFTQIDNMFNKLGAVISSKSSKNEKFTSLTILVDMKSADEIIEKYKEVGMVEGVISL